MQVNKTMQNKKLQTETYPKIKIAVTHNTKLKKDL